MTALVFGVDDESMEDVDSVLDVMRKPVVMPSFAVGDQFGNIKLTQMTGFSDDMNVTLNVDQAVGIAEADVDMAETFFDMYSAAVASVKLEENNKRYDS